MSAPRRHREAGFTILEVLIALVVVAVTAAALLQSIGVGLRGAGDADDASAAVEIARSLLARAGVERSFEDATLSGREPSGHAWRIAMAPYAGDRAKVGFGSTATPAAAWWVTVEVTWPDRRRADTSGRYSVTTLKLASQP